MTTRNWILLGYSLALLSATLLWLSGRFWPQRIASVDIIIRHMVASRSSRLALVVIWWWLGWHYLAAEG